MLLALSFILPGADLDRAVFSVVYNVLAGSASIFGILGAVRVSKPPGKDDVGFGKRLEANVRYLQFIPPLMSTYTIVHTTTLSFVTIALATLILPFDFWLPNPIVPSYRVDGLGICRDIDAGFGWDESWLESCAKSFSVVKWLIAGFGLLLIVAQWWALMSVRRWGKEMRLQTQRRAGEDVEKAEVVRKDDVMIDEKMGY
jgi:hypothetical protein